MKHVYFVSFVHDRGHGNTEVILDGRLSSIQTINTIQADLERSHPHLGKICLMNFQLLRKHF